VALSVFRAATSQLSSAFSPTVPMIAQAVGQFTITPQQRSQTVPSVMTPQATLMPHRQVVAQ
jgi:hypothetical protein